MPLFVPGRLILAGGLISSASLQSGSGAATLVSQGFTTLTTVWPTANLAFYMNFVLEIPVTVYQISWENGATLSGNLDVGIYNDAGTRLVSKGSTAQAGVSVRQVADITDTALVPGYYHMAMVFDNAAATVRCSTLSLRCTRVAAVQQQATAFVLPATATFAAHAQNFTPWLCLHLVAGI